MDDDILVTYQRQSDGTWTVRLARPVKLAGGTKWAVRTIRNADVPQVVAEIATSTGAIEVKPRLDSRGRPGFVLRYADETVEWLPE